MQRTKLTDEYFDCQPEKTFTVGMGKYVPQKVHIGKNRYADNGVRAAGLYFVENDFLRIVPETVLKDFKEFLEANALSGNRLKIKLSGEKSYAKEEFKIKVTDLGCEIITGEAEGARRALITLEDLIVSGEGFLEKGEIRKKAFLERRISRCFFSPINRPPHNKEELGDDIDYYPEGYLRKLMHNGINAIWIYSDFAALIKSPYITEFGVGREKKIKKLNSIIEKCGKFGIEVFLFLIEPISLFEPSVTAKYPEIYKKYPQVKGNSTSGPAAFCTFTEFGEKYLAQAVRDLFVSSPDLAGIMSITFGERVTSCANSWPDSKGNWYNNCPHCKGRSRAEIFAHTISIIAESMKRVKPKAEFISWTYGHRGQPRSFIEECVEKTPNGVITMQNFEDDGRVLQLGRKRFAMDYYLCYAGPSEMFEFTAEKSRKYNKKLYAKMQICCSHELATMPYIPVPGLVYDKIIKSKKLGVKGVMESWFFGNYPCLMSKAVELLSYDFEYKNKDEFLLNLAGLYWPVDKASVVVKAWKFFEKGYKNYPINVMFNYYGPMHDGVVWELALLPKNFSLPRTWQLADRPDGDRIGECLFTGHTLEEAIILCKKLCKQWKNGLKELSVLPEWADENNEQIAVAKGLGILFESGLDILMFYKYRNSLGYGLGGIEILKQMKQIVNNEILLSEHMISLCKKHNCFGYHSEAEGFKFFPEKIENRVRALKNLLKTEFEIVENRIRKGQSALDYYQGKEEGVSEYIAGRNGLEGALWTMFGDDKVRFRLAEDGGEIKLELQSNVKTDFFVCFEFELMFPQPTYIFTSDGGVDLHRDAKTHQSVLDEKIDEWVSKWKITSYSGKEKTHIVATAEKKNIGFKGFPFKLMIRDFYGDNWCADEKPVRVLGKSTISPGDFGWIK